MQSLNCKVKLKIKWKKYCVLAAAGNYNTNNNCDNIIFTIKDKNYMFLSSFYHKKTVKSYQNI